ncbi:hypothetical protein B9Z55_027927 [Caenorhabditis nigoni]|uniref:Homeobox domain-containing protein n=1 Tax=Caenorhabditis nigoni TaxID=1611254 RepID=A0A2G5SE69_9PELO|nr:hypothetical protein B9Z55_027927 [Caenorhabditis nigoni]
MVEVQEMITESSRPFEEQQFLERNKKELRRKTGCHEEIMSEWFRQKRMTVQRLFFNIEVPALPEELANLERISNSYEFENAILAYVIFQIETTENVYGDDVASYLCEREMITEELQQRVGDQFEKNEERVEEGSEDQRTGKDHSIVPEDEMGEQEDVQPVVNQEAVEPEIGNIKQPSWLMICQSVWRTTSRASTASGWHAQIRWHWL